MTPSVGVIAAGGQTGHYMVRALADRGLQTRGLVRSVRSAAAAWQAGASETVHIELAGEASIAKAIAGLDTLVFIAPPLMHRRRPMQPTRWRRQERKALTASSTTRCFTPLFQASRITDAS